MFKQDDHFSYKNCSQYGSCNMADSSTLKEALEEMIELLLGSGGELELEGLVLQLSSHNRRLVSDLGALEFVKRFPQLFSQAKMGKSKSKVMIRLDIPLEFCTQAGEKGGCVAKGCGALHLCPFFIKGTCKFGLKCKRSHNYGDEHTVGILNRFRLGFLTKHPSSSLLQRIFKMIVDKSELQRTAANRSVPDICKFYNKATCKKADNCPCLHVCEHFIDGDCKFGEGCKREHDFSDPHNKKVLEEYDMDGISELKVLQRLKSRERKRTVSRSSDVEKPDKVFPRAASPNALFCSVPDICKFYNKATCKKADNCPCLHVCEHFIDGDCKFGEGCKREHDFSDPHNKKVLEEYDMDGISELKVLQRLKARERKRTVSGSSDVEKPDTVFPKAASPNALVPTTQAKDKNEKETEICAFNLRGKCNYGNNCIHRHTELPYWWEFSVHGEQWESFSSDLNTMLEQTYCDVKESSCTVMIRGILHRIKFDGMTAEPVLPDDGKYLLFDSYKQYYI